MEGPAFRIMAAAAGLGLGLAYPGRSSAAAFLGALGDEAGWFYLFLSTFLNYFTIA